jgi:hypothetical protein
MNQLQYHEAAVELLPVRPKVSLERVKLIDELEHDKKLILPAAVREWYSLEGAESILQDHSDRDHPYSLEKFADFVVEDCLPFQREEVDCYDWVLPLNGFDDPPVYADAGDTAYKCSDSFSDWIYCRIWDFERTHFGALNRTQMKMTSNRYPTVQISLTSHSSPIPARVLETFMLDRVDYFGEETVRRYYRGQQYLRICEGRSCFITGETEIDLEELLCELITAGISLETIVAHDSRRTSLDQKTPTQVIVDRLNARFNPPSLRQINPPSLRQKILNFLIRPSW